MSKGTRRRAWKVQAALKRTPAEFMPPIPKKHDNRRADKSRRWRGGD